MTGETVRYLEAKRSVDERSLSSRVIDTLCDELPDEPTLFDAGCGTGVAVPRMLEWGITEGTYTGVDTSETVVEVARTARADELRNSGYEVQKLPSGFRVDSLSARFEVGDALETVSESEPPDLILAQQFMDLVGIERALDVFEAALPAGGLAYFPLTFDGVSLFEPAHSADADVISAYHATMDERVDGDSRAGRHLAVALEQRSGELVSMDSSDAIIRPRNGSYPADEAFVLDTILSFVESELSGEEVSGFDDWLCTRRQQRRDGELFYIAHRYDLLYKFTRK